MKIKFLKAFNGDSILISFKDNDNISRNIIIDGGMAGTYYDSNTNSFGQLKEEIDIIKEKNEKIDLLILTHYDNDHILGLLKWFELDSKANEIIDKVLFNSGKIIANYLRETENKDLIIKLNTNSSYTGVDEGIEFEKYLESKTNWDKEIIIKPEIKEIYGIKIQILSPSRNQLIKLIREYKKKTGEDVYTSGKEKDWSIDLNSFIIEENKSDFKFSEDGSPSNGSSIAFILTYNNKNFLFTGDANPKVIIESLNELGFNKKKQLEVELFKLSHHGSKKNTNKELIETIKTNNFCICTDSSTHNHPNKRTIARILNINPKATFYFNYPELRSEIFNCTDFTNFPDFNAKEIIEFNIE